jgi:hypothetical protein
VTTPKPTARGAFWDKVLCLGALALLLSLGACTTPLPANASCHAQWETYANDRMNGALAGGLIGASLSGKRPTC